MKKEDWVLNIYQNIEDLLYSKNEIKKLKINIE